MLSVYQVISGNLNKAVNEHGEGILKQPLIKNMRVVKKEILTLLSTWLARAFDSRSVCFYILKKLLICFLGFDYNYCFFSGRKCVKTNVYDSFA